MLLLEGSSAEPVSAVGSPDDVVTSDTTASFRQPSGQQLGTLQLHD
jgi:hypothetical protein